ncbi:hypothetical protein V2I01_28510 [Micromonospora sp. BRA006-A]|nr:hypothetical protein [Micromonospora sp. BRA006-A]
MGQYLSLLEQVGAAEPRARQRIGAPGTPRRPPSRAGPRWPRRNGSRR